ncbi:MAG: hypothetical protein LBT40_14665, partial [Deltaproteobacteria bacterium]|nr:hypothetical protein [Deltaproteobacteria bacterium]
MSSRSYVNMTPEERKVEEEARRRREQAAEAVAKALAAREERLKALLADRLAELAKAAASELKGSGMLETVAEAEAKAAARAGAAGNTAAAKARMTSSEVMSKVKRILPGAQPREPRGRGRGREPGGRDEGGHGPAKSRSHTRRREGSPGQGAHGSAAHRYVPQGARLHRRGQAKGAAGADLADRAARLMGQRRILDEDMDRIRLEYLKLREADRVAAVNMALLKRAREVLSEKGYSLLDARGRLVPDGFPLAKEGTYWFAGDNTKFRVRVEVDDKGGLNLQLKRIVATEDEAKKAADEYTLGQERDESQKWCGAQDALAEVLERENARYVHTIHEKPGEGPLPVHEDRALKSGGAGGG